MKPNAEIDEDRTSRRRIDHDVVRLQIAMHDALRVRIHHGVRDFSQECVRLVDGKLRVSCEVSAQALAFHEPRDEIRDAAPEAHVVDRHDGGVIQPRRLARLADEPFPSAVAGGQVRLQDFDRDRAVRVAVGGAIDNHHVAAANLGVEGVVRFEQGRDSAEEIVGQGSGVLHRVGRVLVKPQQEICQPFFQEDSLLA